MARRPSLWVVVRVAPQVSRWSDTPEFNLYTGTESPGGAPVSAFVKQEDAEAEVARLHALAARETPIGPFLRGQLPDDREQISKAASAAGVPEPDFIYVGPVVKPLIDTYGDETYSEAHAEYSQKLERAVREWWDGIAETVSPDALAKLWEVLFPDFSFYRIGRVLLEG